MQFRYTLILGFILILLIGYVFLVELPHQRKQETMELAAKKVFVLNESEIESIHVVHTDENILLERSETNGWHITSPVSAEPDDRAVSSLLSTISDMQLNRVIEEYSKDPSQFGLEQPSLKIVLSLKEGEEQVLVGDEGPTQNTLYLMQGSTQRVVLVDHWIKGSLSKTLFDLRNKKIASFDQDQISSIDLAFADHQISAQKVGNRWLIQEPHIAEGDPDIIQDLLINLSTARATRIIDHPQEIDQLLEDLPPALIVTYQASDQTSNLFFYHSADGSTAFARSSDGPTLYQIPSSVLAEIQPETFYYQDKHLLRFEKEMIFEINVRTPDEAYRLNNNQGHWSVDGQVLTLDQDEVFLFIQRLMKIRALEQSENDVDLRLAGLEFPRVSVELLDHEGKTVSALRIGLESSGKLFAMGHSELGIVLVDANTVDDIPRLDEIIKVEDPPSSPPEPDLP